MGGEPLARPLKALQKAGRRQVQSFGGVGVRKSRERDQQQRLAQLQRQRPNGAGDLRAATLDGRLAPSLVAFLKRKSPHMPPIKLNEAGVNLDAAERAGDPRLLYRRDRRLPKEFVRKAASAGVVSHEPVIPRQRDRKTSQSGGIV
jgi:hypothetical protein